MSGTEFELSTKRAVEEVARLQAALRGLAETGDLPEQKFAQGSKAWGAELKKLQKVYEKLAQTMATSGVEQGKANKIADATAASLVLTMQKLTQQNLQASYAARAYSGEMKQLQALMNDTNGMKSFVKYQQQSANLAKDQAEQNKFLQVALKQLVSEVGRTNAVLKAQVGITNQVLTEDIRLRGELGKLQRAHRDFNGSVREQIAVEKEALRGKVQAATQVQRELNQVEALRAHHESLKNGYAKEAAILKVMTQAREREVTEEARQKVSLVELHRELKSLNGGMGESILKAQMAVEARKKEIRENNRAAVSVKELTQAEAQAIAATERSASATKAKNSAMMEAARATQLMTRQEAEAQAKAEAHAASTKKLNTALLEEARAAHGMSKAQQELNAAREKEIEKLSRLRAQKDLMNSATGREMTALKVQIAQQERYNRLLAMTVPQLLGFASAQNKASLSLHAGSQAAAMMRATLGGLQTSIGMYTSSTILAASATYAIVRALKESVTLGAEFTATMARADAIMSKGGESWLTSNMAAMESQVRALGQTTVYTASEVAGGLVELGQAGLSATDAITALKPALDMALIGNISMAESSDIATNVMMTFGMQAKDLGGIVDEMAFAVSNSNTTISQLANALSYAGPAAEAAGISMRETIVAVEVLSNSGIKASRAGTAMRRMFTSLLNPTKKGQKVLDEYGISVKNLDGSTRPLVEVLGQLQSALANVSEGERLTAIQNLVGLYATSSVAALIKGTDSFKKALRDHEILVEGAAERMRKKMEQGLKFDWKQTLSAFEEVQLQFFDSFEMRLRNASASLTKLLTDLTMPVAAWDKNGSVITLPDVKAAENAAADGKRKIEHQVKTGQLTPQQGLAAQLELADKVASSLDDTMKLMADSSNTVITRLDEIIGQAQKLGETLAYAVAGFAAFKLASGVGNGVFGALAADAGKFSLAMQVATEKAKGAASAQAVLAASTARATGGLAAFNVAATTGYVGVGLLTSAVAKGATALQFMGTAANVAMRALGWAGLIWGLYEAGKAFFGADINDGIDTQKAKADQLKESYDRLRESFEAYGLARERAALREQVKSNDQQIQDIANRREVLQNQASDPRIGMHAGIISELERLIEKEKTLQENTRTTNELLAKRATDVVDLQNVNDRIEAKTIELAEALKNHPSASGSLLRAGAEEMAKADEHIITLRRELDALKGTAVEVANSLETIGLMLSDLANQQTEAMRKVNEDLYATPGELAAKHRQAASEAKAEYEKLQAAAEGQATATKRLVEIEKEERELRSSGAALLSQETSARLVALDTEKKQLAQQMQVMVGKDNLTRASKKYMEAAEEEAKSNKNLREEVIKGIKADEELGDLRLSDAEKLGKVSRALRVVEEDEKRLAAQRAALARGDQDAVPNEVLAEREAAIKQRRLDLTKEQISLEKALEQARKKADKPDKDAESLASYIAKIQLATSSANLLAEAYLNGTYSLADLTRQQKIEEGVLKHGEAARLAITAAIKSQFDAEDQRDVSKAVHEIRTETSAIIDETAAVYAGTAALQAYNVEKMVSEQLAGKNAAAVTEQAEAYREAARASLEAKEGLENANAYQGIQDRFDKMGALNRQYAKDVQSILGAIEAGVPGVEKTLEGLRQEYEANARELTAWGKLTDAAIERVDEAFADAWKNIDQGFDGFADGLKEGFKQLLAELAHEAITKPIVISFANSILGTNKPGGISDVWGAISGSGGGGSDGGSGLGKLLQYGQTAYGAATGWGPAAMAGYKTGGIWGGVKGVGSYYGNMVSNAAGSVSGFFGGGAGAAIGADGVVGGTGVMLDATGTAVNMGASAAGGVNLAALATPAAIVAAVYAAVSAYNAQKNGYRPEADIYKEDRKFKGATGIGNTVTNHVVYTAAKVNEELARINTQVFGKGFIGRVANIGSTIVGTAIESLFGGGWEYDSSGIAMRVKQGQFNAQNYDLYKRDGGLLGKDGKKYEYSDMTAREQKPLLRQFDAVTKQASSNFKKLGFEVKDDALNGLAVSRKHIKGGSSEKAQARIEKSMDAWFGKVGNKATATIGGDLVTGFARQIQADVDAAIKTKAQELGASEEQAATLLGLTGNRLKGALKKIGIDSAEAVGAVTAAANEASAKTLKLLTSLDAEAAKAIEGLTGKKLEAKLRELTGFGEKSYEALTALVLKLETVNVTFEMLGIKMYDASLAGAALAEDMILLAGGMEAFQASTAAYYDKFFNEGEKAADTVESVLRQFAELDQVLPTTRQQYRELVESIDASTESGRELVAQLLNLAAAADSAYTAFDTMRANAAAAVDEARQNVIAAYERESSALEDTIEQFDSFTESLKDFRKQLSEAMRVTESPTVQIDTLRRQFQSTANRAKLGDTAAMGELPGVGTSLAAASLDYASTREDYIRELAAMQNTVYEVEQVAGRQSSIAQQQLDALKEQIDALGLINESVLSLADAIKILAETELAAKNGELEFIGKLMKEGFEALKPTQVVSVLGMGFGALDANLDTLITTEEMKSGLKDKATDEQLKALGYVVDSNFDGLISATEVAAAASLSQGQMIAQGLAGIQQAMGTAISLAQAQAALGSIAASKAIAEQFAKQDTNKDGTLSGKELGNTSGTGTTTSVVDKLYASGGYTTAKQSTYDNWIAYEQTYGAAATAAEWARLGNKGTAFATGGAFTNSIVKRATEFDMGVMGEAGPEAILPLANVGGSLGVRAVGGGNDTEIRALRSEMGAALRAIAKSTMQTAKRLEYLERWDVNGLPKELTA